MSDETRRQVFEMYIGVILHNAVIGLICLIWFREPYVFLGIAAGMAAALVFLVSLAMSAEVCTASGSEAYASKKMALHAVLRSLGILAALLLLWKFTKVNILTAALGVLRVKTGAYLYPAVHRLMNHRTEGN